MALMIQYFLEVWQSPEFVPKHSGANVKQNGLNAGSAAPAF